jgi:iron complex outermembrane receptor protein
VPSLLEKKLTAGLATVARSLLLASLALVALTSSSAQESAAGTGLGALKQLSLEELMNLEVTSVSKRPEKLLSAPSAIQVITGDAIRRSGATTIPDALRLAGNLEVAQKGAHAWGVSARGFNTDLANKLLVLVDGRAVYTPLYSGVFWTRQDYLLEDIDRIEVISGPGSTLWGANAVNGVINITTRSAADTQGLYLEAGTGDKLPGLAGLRYGGSLGPKVHYRIYGRYADRDGAVFADGQTAHDQWQMAQGGFRVDAETPAGDDFTLQGDVYSSDQEMSTGGTAHERGHNLLGRWSRTLVNGSDLRLQLYYDHTHFETPAAALVLNGITFAPAGTIRDDLDTYDLDLQHRIQVGARQEIVWGLGYRFTHDLVANAPSLGFLPPKLDQELFSAFLQDQIKLRKDLALTLGTKVEHTDYTGIETEPSARVLWQLTDTRTVWAAVSRAVRTPSRIDRDLSQATPPNFVVLRGSPDFVSEKLIAYEAGYRTQVGPRLAAALAVFYNRYDDVRSTSLTPVTIVPFYFANNLQGETHGLELSLDYEAAVWWRLHGNFNLLREHLHAKPGQTDLNHALNETADPEHQLALISSMDLPQNWFLDTTVRWVDEFAINNGGVPATVAAYAELDLRLAWRPVPNIELSLAGRNLLHDHHAEYGAPGPTRLENARSFHGKIAWRF